ILVSDLRVGDTLEVAYTREGQNPVFGNKFIDSTSWDYGFPSVQRRLVLTHPVDRQVHWKVLGGQGQKLPPLAPTETVEGGMRRLVCAERSLLKVQGEPFTPPDASPYRWLQFSEFSGWEDVVAWAERLFQSQDEPPEELRELVANLRAKATDAERVAA